jgi:hypothetical protein
MAEIAACSTRPALEILAAVEQLPDMADLERIEADEDFGIVLDRAHHRLLAARQAAFTPAENAFVGLDLDDELVTGTHPDGVGLDGSNLHFTCSSAARIFPARLAERGC